MLGWNGCPFGATVSMTDKALDDAALTKLKDVLTRKRGDILAASTGTRPLPESADVNSRQGDRQRDKHCPTCAP